MPRKKKAQPEPEPLQLIPDEPLDPLFHMMVALIELPEEIAAPPPSAHMIESVKRWGVISPIILLCPKEWVRRDDIGNTSELVIEDGRGRILAARAAGLETIPAQIFAQGSFSPGVLTMMLNAQRRSNKIVELGIVEDLLKRGGTQLDIAAATGKSISEIAALLTLSNLTQPLRYALEHGQVTTGAAHRAAKLTAPQMTRLEAVLDENGKITADDVKACRKTERDAAVLAVDWEGLETKPMPASGWKALLIGQLRQVESTLPQDTPEAIRLCLCEMIVTVEEAP